MKLGAYNHDNGGINGSLVIKVYPREFYLKLHKSIKSSG